MDEDQDQSQTTGVEDAGAADPQGQEAGQEPEAQEPEGSVAPAPADERTEQAFAKRLAAERQRIRAELEAAVATRTPPSPIAPQPSQADLVNQVAEATGLDPSAAAILVSIAQQNQALAASQQRIADEAEAARLKASDPAFDREAADKARADFVKRYGVAPSLEDAWAFASRTRNADTARRQAEQAVLRQQEQGRRAGTASPAGGGGKPSIAEMPKSDFEAMVARVKAGGRVE